MSYSLGIRFTAECVEQSTSCEGLGHMMVAHTMSDSRLDFGKSGQWIRENRR